MNARNLFCLSFLSVFCWGIRADVVECENGDRYTGKVLSLNEKELKIQNDIQGAISIPREKITIISFRPGKAVASHPQTALIQTNTAIQLDPSTVSKVQQQFLGDASPEANQMFQEMVNGLMSGKLDLSDIRKKAQSTLGELKQLQNEIGQEEGSELLGSYASILESFLNASSATNSVSPAPRTNKPVEPKDH